VDSDVLGGDGGSSPGDVSVTQVGIWTGSCATDRAGRSVSGVEIAVIYHERLKFRGGLAALSEDIDLLLIPTMPMPIPTLTKMSEYGADPNVLLNILRFTAVFDFGGSPTITLPMGMASDRMPLSM
jgi:amidase